MGFQELLIKIFLFLLINKLLVNYFFLNCYLFNNKY